VSEHHVRFPMRPGVLADHDLAVARIRPSIQRRHNRPKCCGVYFSARRQTYPVNHLSRRARKLPGSNGFATLIPRARSAPSRSIIQIDADGQKLRPEKSHSSGIARAATNVIAQPALPRERIVIGEQMRRASVPAGM
jgi:hypothetical protein